MRDFTSHRLRCEADAPRLTHLVALHTSEEIVALDIALAALMLPEDRFWIGAEQLPDQQSDDEGWKVITDNGDLPPNMWTGNEPNDGLDGIEDDDENVAFLDVVAMPGYLRDGEPQIARGAVCECE
jgi:hypothetical protein